MTSANADDQQPDTQPHKPAKLCDQGRAPAPCSARIHPVPKRNKPHARARARAIRALEMYVAGATDAQVASALGYASESGARMARQRELNRRSVSAAGEMRKVHGERLLSLLRACWPKAAAGDDAAIRTAARLLDSISRLYGLDAAMQIHVRPGISEREFAEQAAELLKVTGIRPLVEAALPALPPSEREGWLRAADATADDDADSEPWANIGTADYVTARPETPVDAPTPSHPETPDGRSPWLSEDDDQDADAEEVAEIVEAEIVAEVVPLPPLPPGQRRVRSDEVLTSDGVPISRSGIARRLGEYDPLQHWRV